MIFFYFVAAYTLAKDIGGKFIISMIAVAIIGAVMVGLCCMAPAIGGTVFLIAFMALIYSYHKAIRIIIAIAFAVSIAVYFITKKSDNEKLQEALAAHASREKDYERNKLRRIEDIKQQIVSLNQNLNLLNARYAKDKELLDTYYSLGVLFSKYHHNANAIVKFLEYLQSQRCDSLIGENGAYNIYEREWRMDAIISGISNLQSALIGMARNLRSISNNLTGIDSGTLHIDKTIDDQFNAINHLENNNSKTGENAIDSQNLEKIHAEQLQRLSVYRKTLK